MTPTSVSIIIATYKRPAMLRDTISSLREMTVPNGIRVEIVVVDNDAAGTARQITLETAAETIEPFTIRYVHEKTSGLSQARNRGIAEAVGEIIAFLDDDVYVCQGWLVAILDCFQRTGAAAVGGRTLAHWEGEPEAAVRASQRLTVDNDLGECDREVRTRATPGGGNAAFRHEVFAGGLRFATNLGRIGTMLLSGEDSELFRRMQKEGQPIWHCAGAVVAHRIAGERLTAAYLVEKKYWFGISYAVIDLRLHGKLYQIGCASGRVVKAVLLDLPRWALAALRGDAARRLIVRCSLAKQWGYLRGTLSWQAFAPAAARTS